MATPRNRRVQTFDEAPITILRVAASSVRKQGSGIVGAKSRERILPMTESFEEAYPRYDFAALVGFGLAFAALVARAPAKRSPGSTAAPATR